MNTYTNTRLHPRTAARLIAAIEREQWTDDDRAPIIAAVVADRDACATDDQRELVNDIHDFFFSRPPQRVTVLAFADDARHLVTIPNDRATLFAAADQLNIPRHWYHASATHQHIDIPVRDVRRIAADFRIVTVNRRDVLAITTGHRL